MFIDSHAHCNLCIQDKENPITEEELVEKLKENKVKAIVQVTNEPLEFQWSVDFATRINETINCYFALGIHPSVNYNINDFRYMSNFVQRSLLEHRDQLLGIGECGLDYHYEDGLSKKEQKELFNYQLNLARKFNLPIIVHSREAMEDTISLLQKSRVNQGIIHCFSGNKDDAKKLIDLGFMISFAGNVTFKNATDLQEAAKYVPVDRILCETDSPFLAPVPKRGKTNRPYYVKHVYEYLALTKGIEISELAEQMEKNFKSLLA